MINEIRKKIIKLLQDLYQELLDEINSGERESNEKVNNYLKKIEQIKEELHKIDNKDAEKEKIEEIRKRIQEID